MYENIRHIRSEKFISSEKWKYSDGVSDNYELIIVISGTLYIQLGGLEYILTKGDVLRIDPNTPHGGTRVSEQRTVFFRIQFHAENNSELPSRYLRLNDIKQTELLCKLLIYYNRTEGYPEECSDLLLKLLMTELTSENIRRLAAADTLYSEIRSWVRSNCRLPIKVSDIAEHFDYNEDYIGRVFKKYYPSGLKAYIAAVKLEKIKKCLVSGELTLQEISESYGFDDYKYFLKFFKYHTGISPTVYKQKYYKVKKENDKEQSKK